MSSLNFKLPTIFKEKLPFPFELLPNPTYLVGGAVRDALLDRPSPYLDLDFVLPSQAVETARHIAQRCQGGFVVLDQERQIARVVFANGTADFAKQEGKTIEADLRRRDFRVNAIAYNLHSEELIDPLQGIKDIEARILRVIAKGNLESDPLRILRAYRQGAQLNFTINAHTRSLLRTLAPLLARVAAERVQQELNYLLQTPQGNQWLYTAWEDGVLTVWLKGITEQQVKQVEQIDQTAWLLGRIWTDLEQQLKGSVSNQSLSWLNLAKLASLVSKDQAEAESQLNLLKYSRAEIKAVTIGVKYLPRLLSLPEHQMDLEEQYFFFLGVGNAFPMLATLAVAAIAHQDLLRETRAVAAIAPLVNSYLDPENQIAHPTPLVTGDELMHHLSLPPSPKIGQLLTQIQLARIQGTLTTPQEALNYAANWQSKG